MASLVNWCNSFFEPQKRVHPPYVDQIIGTPQKVLGSKEEDASPFNASPKPEEKAEEKPAEPEQKDDSAAWSVLEKCDDVATNSVLDTLKANEEFLKLAESETKDILDRDEQDATALKKGIKLAQEKKVLPEIEADPYTQIDVLGKSADNVADEMIEKLGESASSGCVLVLVGLSGTGKGTTVEKLKGKLSKATTWSNGNVFRCLTTLACDFAEKENIELEKLADVLTPENLKAWTERLTFGKFDDKWDLEMTRLTDQKVRVSDVCNTLLKEPRVSKNIPTVASFTQGEVVNFAADACTQMGKDGSVVIVEGREDTVNFIPTPHRFCLTISDTSLIGKRRAAQRILAHALKEQEKGEAAQALGSAVTALVAA